MKLASDGQRLDGQVANAAATRPRSSVMRATRSSISAPNGARRDRPAACVKAERWYGQGHRSQAVDDLRSATR